MQRRAEAVLEQLLVCLLLVSYCWASCCCRAASLCGAGTYVCEDCWRSKHIRCKDQTVISINSYAQHGKFCSTALLNVLESQRVHVQPRVTWIDSCMIDRAAAHHAGPCMHCPKLTKYAIESEWKARQ